MCDGSLFEFMEKTHILIRHKEFDILSRDDTQSLIFSVGMGTQASLMLIKMLLFCPDGSRSDWMPHEKTGSHVISRSCFSYPVI